MPEAIFDKAENFKYFPPKTLPSGFFIFMIDYNKPTLSIIMKLGSLFVHVEEFFSTDGNPVDKNAIETILQDQEVQDFLSAMDKDALLPVKRNKR